MRSLNNAICTSGDPVSFVCTRNCSINSGFGFHQLAPPLKRRALLYALASSSTNASIELQQRDFRRYSL